MGDHVPNGVREHIARAVRAGFDGEEDIVEWAAEYAEDEHGGVDRDRIREVTAELLAAHRAEQAGWPDPTDCDRLDAAFAAMQRRGVIARQNFSCCSNCGHAEMWGEMRSPPPNWLVEGYAFYHMQDTERAVEGGGLYVKYGAVEEGEEAAAAVGRVVAEELRNAGLTVEWDGSPDRAVGVVGLDWKRRR
jgi:hypothetical protein